MRSLISSATLLATLVLFTLGACGDITVAPGDLCEPSCANMECGDDGCGGSCGSCATNERCNAAGLCVPVATCTPDCDDKECGDDGCQGVCGTCAVGEECQAGLCVPLTVCTPDCDGKECGDDGCDGSCGPCPTGEECQAGVCVPSTCVPDCADKECGDDGCGESCGTCPDDHWCSAGECVPGVCEPDCTDKDCGDDGCDGSCGTCAEDEYCTVLFECAPDFCIPDCTAKDCGDNGCNGSCGECGADEFCTAAGRCESTFCEPDCTDKECGDDGCGGDCGACNQAGAVCVAYACVCVPETDKTCCTTDEGGSAVCWVDSCGNTGEVLTVCAHGCNENLIRCDNCEPDCLGKDCGDDGCGGDCGPCTQEGAICERYRCVCRPEQAVVCCAGADGVTINSLCWVDSCGNISDPFELCEAGCVNNACCEPDCRGRECGPEPVCGTSCGRCSLPQTCVSGRCVDCRTDRDCPRGLYCMGGTCVSFSGDACINEADIKALSERHFTEALEYCMPVCRREPTVTCIGPCTQEFGRYSTDCSMCIGYLGQCIIERCGTFCGGLDPRGCEDCIASNCQPSFEACSGLVGGQVPTNPQMQ